MAAAKSVYSIKNFNLFSKVTYVKQTTYSRLYTYISSAQKAGLNIKGG